MGRDHDHRHEVDWLTWSMGEIYPEAFAKLLALVPGLERGGNLPVAYNRLLIVMTRTCKNVPRDRGAHRKTDWEPCMDRRSRAPATPTLHFASALLAW